MRIERVRWPETTIEVFAGAHDLTMVVREHPPERCSARFTASFKSVEVMDGGILSSPFGAGDTEVEAIHSYASVISMRRIAIDAWQRTRREIDVPRLVLSVAQRRTA